MGDATKIDMNDWDRDFRINVTSMVLMCRHVIPEFRKNGRGAIVNMSSVSGRMCHLSPSDCKSCSLKSFKYSVETQVCCTPHQKELSSK